MTDQRSLFDLEAPVEPSRFEEAVGEVGDMLDRWQEVLPADEWTRLWEQVETLFRFTIGEEKDRPSK